MKSLVLFIDDNELDLKIAALSLARIEIECVGFTDYKEGLAWLEKNTPKVILLDLQMPKTTGYKLIPQIRGKPGMEKVPILIVSGMNQAADVRQAIKAGAADYIIKPIDPMILQEKVTRAQNNTSSDFVDIQVPPSLMPNVHFTLPVTVVGLSEFGVRLISATEIKPGETIEIGGLLKEDLGIDSIWLRCLTSEKKPGTGEFAMAFSFIGLGERERQVLRRSCRQIWVQSKASG